jgi:tetratricopeptide (TPR) repeat protein
LDNSLKNHGAFEEALAIFKQLISKFSEMNDQAQLAESFAGMAQCQKELNILDEALENYLKAIEKFKNEKIAIASDGPSGEHARRMLAQCYYNAAAIQIQKLQLAEAVLTNKEGRLFDKTRPDEVYSKLLKQQQAELEQR